MIRKTLKNFFELEAATGILLIFATAFALLVANSSESGIYFEFINISLPLNVEVLKIHKNLSLRDWVNDGLMAVFFLLIGLELKKEVMVGHLSSKKRVMLPALAAIGGIIVPAGIFIFFNLHYAHHLRGFAIPTATDIAFAYGMLCLFGKKIPNSLKVFIVALAVIDDLVAILIIAFFYTANVKFFYLFLSLLPITGLYLLNSRKSYHIWLYLIFGAILWLLVLKSGLHATIAGVVLALFIPLSIRNRKVLENFAHKIAPVVNFLILPVFAFVNSGIAVQHFSYDIFSSPLVFGIIAGMFIGKQVGVMLFSYLAIKFKHAHLPQGINWLEFYGAAIFTGIGFTMSIFIASLAFPETSVTMRIILDEVKLAILAGSALSIVYGIIITLISLNKRLFR